MNKKLPKWLSEAITRIKAEHVKIIAYTPEKAKEHDDCIVREILRDCTELWEERIQR